ncbi:polyphosphate kinase 1 [Olsenella sp. YH-ols2217]|uniref:Polyphosphate kinase n=1 Tax=Kribbibacterium absianum TaxID=3044210 RepID=A0ABT6ZLU3_9ACTN|nr:MULTISPECIES: polyphosphate kinase 1 [unclassified Olsenella]MDJ1122016.1 polyphosphate kinase 1 [Olsenella sp. YH-ols2216]MDJ1130024.1 polyphosphate kinase 1 [Olsenella sp. YH-ols2217]
MAKNPKKGSGKESRKARKKQKRAQDKAQDKKLRRDTPKPLREKKGSASAAYAKQANKKGHERSKQARPKNEAPEKHERDYSYTQNRELSWLRFDDRVLTEALTPEVPLFERLKFCAIFQSNLDEWFMIRVGGLSTLTTLKRPPLDNKSGMTPQQQLDAIFGELPDMLGRQEGAFAAIERQLVRFGLERVGREDFDDKDNVAVARYFERNLAPILSPLVVDPRHPFPNLRNGQLYVMCALDAGAEGELLGMVEVPASAPRVVELPSRQERFRYALVEDVIAQGLVLSDSFNAYRPVSAAVVRVTRNADVDPDGEGVEEEEDYREHMKKILKRRMRLEPVRVELEGSLGPRLEELVREELGLSPDRVSRMAMPLDLSYVYSLESKLPDRNRQALLFEPFEPQQSPMVDPKRPVREQVEDHDVLLYYPYESMKPLLDLVAQAASDDSCISIRITLYRVATRSRLCESLIAAAENGKDVTVLMELRARFDEKNNIEWAERLDQAGCTVIYGSEGFKCHSKICQVTYHDNDGLTRITCLGTGNFNEKTARLYSDFMLMTADKGIGEDGNNFFRNLTLGNLRGSYKYLGVAPTGLKPLIMRGIEREIARARAGKPAQVFMKMNSLTDRDVIDKIAEATQAGVKMVLIVRGICCIKPGIAGRTDGLEVRQIVGRLLEHSRVYAFGPSADTVYLSSADMMTRNTERRVEIAFPVLDPTCRAMVVEYMDLQMSDNVKARRLTSIGTWERVEAAPDAPLLDSQDVLIALAYHHARIRSQGRQAPLAPELASLPPDVIRRLISLYSSYPLASEPSTRPTGPAPTVSEEPMVEDEMLAQAVTDHDEPLADADAAVKANTAPLSGAPKDNGGVAVAGSEGAVATDAPRPEEPLAPTDPSPAPADAGAFVRPDLVGEATEKAGGALATRKPSRFAAAFSLIGLGIRTLFQGPEAAERARQRVEQKNAEQHRREAERAARRSRTDTNTRGTDETHR